MSRRTPLRDTLRCGDVSPTIKSKNDDDDTDSVSSLSTLDNYYISRGASAMTQSRPNSFYLEKPALKSALKKTHSLSPRKTNFVGNHYHKYTMSSRQLLPVKEQEQLFGCATARRLDLSSRSGEEINLPPLRQTPSTTSSSLSTSSASSDTSQQTCVDGAILPNQIDERPSHAETLTGMSKWRYPKSPSFIVDMNNPPPGDKKDQIAGDVGDNKLSDDNKGSDGVEKSAIEGQNVEIYYPSKSPFKTGLEIATQKQKRKFSAKRSMGKKIKVAILSGILIVAAILYFVLLGQVIEQNKAIKFLGETIAAKGFNRSMPTIACPPWNKTETP